MRFTADQLAAARTLPRICTVGVLAAFASAGIVGAEGGTQLRSMLMSLTNQTAKQKAVMEEYGITLYDAQGNFVGMANLAGQLQDKLGGLDQETRNAAMATMFGSYAIQGANILYKEGAQGIQEWTDAVSDSGYAAEMASARTDNLQGDMEQLSGSFETLLTNLGEGGQGPLRSLVQTLDTLVNAFSGLPEPVQQWLVLGSSAIGIGAALHKSMGPLSDSTSAAARSFSLFADPWQRLTGLAGGVQTAFHQIQLSMMTASQQMDAVGTASSKTELRLGALKSVGGGLLSLLGGPWGIALGVAGGMLLGFAKDAQEAKAKTEEFANAIESGDDILEKLIRDISSGDDGTWGFWDKATTGFGSLGDALDKAGVSYSTFAEAVDGSKEAQEEFNRQLENSGLDGIQLDAIRNSYDELSGQVSDAKDQVQRTNEEVAKVQSTSEDAAAGTEMLGDAMSGTADAAQDVADSVGELVDSLFEIEGVHVSAYEAQTRLQESIQNLSDAFAENGNTLDINTEKGRANRDALSSLASQAMSTAQAILEEGQANNDMAGATENARACLENARTAFINNATAAGMSRSEAERLATQMGLTGDKVDELTFAINSVPGYKSSTVEVRGVDDAIWKVRQLSGEISLIQSKDVTIRVNKVTSETTIHSTLGTKVGSPMKAEGGLIGGYADGGLMRLANGDGYTGLLTGWGGKKSDNILLWGSPGEFMQQASAVDYYGVDMMRALNERKVPREWLQGPTFVAESNPVRNVTLNMPVKVVRSKSDLGAASTILIRNAVREARNIR